MNIKSLALIATLGVAGAASAITLTTQTKGTVTYLGTTSHVVDNAVVGTPVYNPATFTLTNLDYTFDKVTGAGTGTITLVRTSDMAVANVSMAFGGAYTAGAISSAYSTSAVMATLVGSGWLTGYTGTGAFSVTLKGAGQAASRTSLTAQLTAVPEPASMAALAVGAVGLIRRRARKA